MLVVALVSLVITLPRSHTTSLLPPKLGYPCLSPKGSTPIAIPAKQGPQSFLFASYRRRARFRSAMKSSTVEKSCLAHHQIIQGVHKYMI